jgi:hypothetical protein
MLIVISLAFNYGNILQLCNPKRHQNFLKIKKKNKSIEPILQENKNLVIFPIKHHDMGNGIRRWRLVFDC